DVGGEKDHPRTNMTSIHDRIATPDGKRRYVRALFATIADRYDFITVVLSYGRDRRWKRRLIELAAPAKGSPLPHLATGTGDIAFEIERRRARVVGLDLTPRMIELAAGKAASRGEADAETANPAFVVGDMLALPFPARSFDVITTGYGLRNVPDLVAA